MLIEISKAVMKTCNVPEKIGIGLVSYDVPHKLREEIDKLSPGTVEKVLSEIKQILSQWHQ
jgi:hypothetical protein